ncbi:carboxypeptidase B-like [Neocloeon triangulifer]|uniref:carboxypeptidase B-like n=1 Tax=Neocloeon triangulifer TaxID=2078957 RepID=UPI00286F59FB|nr:carboxypeptidase B-like [Neocloeon triangulifer]
MNGVGEKRSVRESTGAMRLAREMALIFLLLAFFASAEEIFETTESTDTTTTSDEFFEEIQEIDEGSSSPQNQTVDFRGAKVFRVKLKNASQNRLFKQLVEEELIDVWLHTKGNASRAEFLILPQNLEKVQSLLQEAKIQPKIMIPDLQKLIKTNDRVNLNNIALRSGYSLNWDEYHQFGVIHAFLDYYATAYPDICTVKTIGKTREERDIKLIKISSGAESNPAVFIDGGIHAREWISPASVTYIIKELVENREKYSSFVDKVDFYIVPLINVDGYEYSHTRDRLWRKNRADLFGFCNGVDLNRNFGYKWGTSGSSFFRCSNIYRGSSAFSEPETKALRDFILESQVNFQAYLSFHSYGQLILYPYGYASNELPDDVDDLDRVGKAAASAVRKLSGTKYTVGNAAQVLYSSSGASDDWAKGDAKIKYSYVVELSDKGKYGFVLPEKFIKSTAADAFEIVKVVADEVRGV